MERTECTTGLEWTAKMLQSLLSQLINVCDMLPERERLKDLESQLTNICFRIGKESDHLPKDVILDLLVGILEGLMSPNVMLNPSTGIPDTEIVDHLTGITMALLSLSENISEKAVTNRTLKRMLLEVVKMSRIVEPAIEIYEYLELVTNIFYDMMSDLANMYSVEWATVNGQIDQDESPVPTRSKEDILDNLVVKLQERLPKVIGIQRVKGKQKEQVLDIFIWTLQQLTSFFIDNPSEGESVTPKSEIREMLIGSIKALLSLLVRRSEMKTLEVKLKDMLSLLVNMTSLNPVIEIPKNLRLLVKMDPKNVPSDLISDYLVEILDYLKSLTESTVTGPVVWLPRNMLLLFMNVPMMLPDIQKYLQTKITKMLFPVPGIHNEDILNPVCVLLVDLDPLLTLSKENFVSDIGKCLEFVSGVFNDIHTELLNICRKEWRSEILYSQINEDNELPESKLLKNQNLKSEFFGMASIPQTVIMDYLVCIIHDKLSEIMDINRTIEKHRDEMLEILLMILQYLTSLLMNEQVSDVPKNGIRDLLIGMIKALLSLFVNISDPSMIKRRLNDTLSQLMNMTNLNPDIEISRNLRPLIEMNPATVPLNIVVYHLSEIFQNLLSLIKSWTGPVVWFPRKLLNLCLHLPKLLPWSMQKKLLSHLQKMLDNAPGIASNKTKNPLSVLRVELVPLMIFEDKLIEIHKNETLDMASEINSYILSSYNVNMPKIEWNSEQFKNLVSELMNVCIELPKHELTLELQSQLINIQCINPVQGIPKDVILDHLVAILQDLLLVFFEYYTVSKLCTNLILNSLYALITALLSLSTTISKMDGLNQMLRGRMLWLVKVSRLHFVRKIWENLAVIWDMFKGASEILNFCSTEWKSEVLYVKIKEEELLSESELLKSPISDYLPKHDIIQLLVMIICEKLSELTLLSGITMNLTIDSLLSAQNDLMSQVIDDQVNMTHKIEIWDHSFEIIREKLSQVKPVYGLPKQQLLEYLIMIIQQMTSLVIDDPVLVCGIPKNEICELLIGTIKALLSILFNMSHMITMKGKLNHMLSQLMQISNVSPVIEVPENLQLLVEMNPELVPIDLIVRHLGEIKVYLESVTECSIGLVVWIPRNMLLLCLKVPRMLPWNFEKKLQSHLKKILHSMHGKSNEQLLDPVCVLPVDLLPLLKMLQFLTLTPKNEILDFAFMTPMDKLSQHVNISKAEWTSKILKELHSELMDVCRTLPKHEFIHDQQSQIKTLAYWTDNVSQIPKDLMLDHFVGILQDIISKAKTIKNRVLKKQILDRLCGIVKTLLSLSQNISEIAPLNRRLEDMLSFLMKIPIIDPVSKINANLTIVENLWDDIKPEIIKNTIKEWESDQILSDIDTGEVPLERDLDSNLYSEPKAKGSDYLFGIIQENMSKVMGISYVGKIPKDQMLHLLVEIFQHLTSLVIDENVNGINNKQKSEIRDYLIGTMKGLLSLNISEMAVIIKRLRDMLSKLLRISSLNPVIEIPEDIGLLIEMDPECVPVDQIMEHLCRMKEFLQSLNECNRGNTVVWVPRNLLILSLHVPTQVFYHRLQKKLQSHLNKILDPVIHGTLKNLDLVSILPADLAPLLIVMESLTTQHDILDNVSTKDQLSQLVKISKTEWRSEKLKDLLSQLMELCNMLPKTMLTKDVQSKLSKVYRDVPASGILDDAFLKKLVAILDNLTSQVMRIDPEWGMQKNPMFPRISTLDMNTDHIAGICTKNIPTDFVSDHQDAIFQDQYYIFQDKEIVHVKMIPRNQVLDDLAGIIRSFQKMTEMAPINGNLKDMLSHLNETRAEGKIIMDPERESLRDHGLELMNMCTVLPECVLLEVLFVQLKYLCRLDHARDIPKAVFQNRLVAIHQELVGFGDKSINVKLKNMLSRLKSKMNIPRMEPETDLMAKYIDLLKLKPENELHKEMQSRIMNILSISKMDASKIPTDQILGIFCVIFNPLCLNVNDITKEKLEENLCWIEQDLTALLQKVHLVGGRPHNIPQDTSTSSLDCTKEEITHLVTWFIDVCEIFPASETLEDLQLQLSNITRVNTLTEISEEVILDHLVGILQDLTSQATENKHESGILKKHILDMLTRITMGILSVTGNTPEKSRFREILMNLLSRVNEIWMSPECKAFKDQTLSVLSVLSKSLQADDHPKQKPQNQMLDHECMRFIYLLSVSLNGTKLTDIRMKLKHLLSQLMNMNVSKTDCGDVSIKEVLSLLVYSFFPASHMFFHPSIASHQLIQRYILKTAEDEKSIYTGSVPENLHLPLIHDLFKGKSPMFPDTDYMIETGWFHECYDAMSCEINEFQPVFCRIKLGFVSDCISENIGKLLEGPYLNSAKVNHLFRHQYQMNLPQCKNRGTTKTEYDSASMAITSADSWISHKDILFCIPVIWSEDYRQSFLERLESNKWPMYSIPNICRLLTERVYAIPKPDPHTKTGHLRWRLSFSVIETELARSLTDIQRRCYRVLKALIKYFVNVGLSESKQFPSYYLKTVMFWFCESSSKEAWKIQNLGVQWLKLVDSVIGSLEKKELCMYFVPTYNLLNDKDASCISVWKERMTKIREQPLRAFKKFWSAYKFGTLHLRSEDWQPGFYTFLFTLNETYRNLTATSQNVEKVKSDEETNKCHWIVSRYLLATYSLKDFLNYVKMFPQGNKPVINSKAGSKEHLMWMYYNEFLSIGFPPYPNVHEYVHGVPDNYSNYWSYLAEVTHHMVLKWVDKVPDKNIFSTKTAERFYLIACFVQNKKGKDNAEKHIKFANFLRAAKQYELAAFVLVKFCQKPHTEHLCTFSRVTQEV